ncbi:uncharacterized protein CEXT_80211 [Caerostris extrusa]|uniref:Uncharacterized protein n=1 Tax=Caerostris extrusa TaxID=172846 RepID=A0AAV4WWT2_CAEEX|nr:uncharacterized protein CEXT_80211 [Caerostris extrusa]
MGTDNKGVLASPIAAEESELNLIDTAFKLLTSADEVVSNEALTSLTHSVQKDQTYSGNLATTEGVAGAKQMRLSRMFSTTAKIASMAWQLRHNSIVARLRNALAPKCSILEITKTFRVPGLRPDPFVRHKQMHYLVDITVSFDNRDAALDVAYQRKIDKYATAIDDLKNQGITATVFPFVVGALGSLYPPNDSSLRKFCAKSYINMFRKVMCQRHN